MCLGTLASSTPWLAAASMTCVAFAVLFVGVVSSELASATPALLLAFILPVSLTGPASQIPDRLAGWGLASAAALVAVTILWPAPSRDPLRAPATAACRALAARLRSDVAYLLGEADAPSEAEHDTAIAEAETAVTALRQAFLATPYRPTGLSTATRTVVRLVDEFGWLSAVIQSGPRRRPPYRQPRGLRGQVGSRDGTRAGSRSAGRDRRFGGRPARGARRGCVTLSRRWSALRPTRRPPSARAPRRQLRATPATSSRRSTPPFAPRSWRTRSPRSQATSTSPQRPSGGAGWIGCWVASPEEWRARWRRRSSARRPTSSAARSGCTTACGAPSVSAWPSWSPTCPASSTRSGSCSAPCRCCVPMRSARARTSPGASGYGGRLRRRSRPARAHRVQHDHLCGPAAARDPARRSRCPPPSRSRPGQAGFTVTLVILFNIIAPAGWRVGLLRVEDVALGCAVSLVVGCCSGPVGPPPRSADPR